MVKKKGIVWNYFTRKVHGSQITAFCKFCDQSYIQNATRMEKHIIRCDKCPQDVKRHFVRVMKTKRAKSIMNINLAENWSLEPSEEQNNSCNDNSQNFTEWEYRNELSNPLSSNAVEHIEVDDSKNWNKNIQIESIQAEETTTNTESQPVNNEIQESAEEPTFTRRSRSNTRFSQLPLLSTRTSMNLVWHNKIQQEQYLERRALRRIAELELERKTLEFEKFQWEFQKEKTQSELRWTHECQMMQLREEQQHQLIEQNRNVGLTMETNPM